MGISKAMDAGLPYWVCIVMGMITGSLGGVIRDVLLNQVPLLFRKDIYALTCVAGGLVYFLLNYLNWMTNLKELIAAIIVIVLRLIAVRFHVHLPLLQPINDDEDSGEVNL